MKACLLHFNVLFFLTFSATPIQVHLSAFIFKLISTLNSKELGRTDLVFLTILALENTSSSFSDIRELKGLALSW